jgi:hypothetical protein
MHKCGPKASRYFSPPVGWVGRHTPLDDEGDNGDNADDIDDEVSSEVSLTVPLILPVKAHWWQGNSWRNETGKVIGAIKYKAKETSLEITILWRNICNGRQKRYMANTAGGGIDLGYLKLHVRVGVKL